MIRKIITMWVCAIMIASTFVMVVNGGNNFEAPVIAPNETIQNVTEDPVYQGSQTNLIESETDGSGWPNQEPAMTHYSDQKPRFDIASEGEILSSNDGQYYEPNTAPWGNWSYRDAHNVPAVEAMGYTGDGVTVALADTGIDFVSENLAGKYMVNDNIASPYYGWPVAFDAVGLPQYLLNKEARPGNGGIADTSLRGTGPFNLDHEIVVDGVNDFFDSESVGTDTYDDIKTPDTATGKEFDLSRLWAAGDDMFWYTGIRTLKAGINRTFGFAMDFDGSATGSIQDPMGNYLDFEASHSAPIEQVAYDSNNDWIASCAASGSYPALTNSYEKNTVKVWDTNGNLIQTLPDESKPVNSVIWSPDGSLLAYQTTTDVVIYDTITWTESDRIVHSLVGGPSNRETMAFSPNGTMLIVGSLQSATDILAINVMTGIYDTISVVENTPRSISYNSDGTMIAIGNTGGKIQILDSTTYAELMSFIAPGLVDVDAASIETLAWGPDGTKIAAGRSDRNTVDIWDLTIGDNRFQWGGEYTKIMGTSFEGLPLVDRFYMRAIPDEVSANGLTTYELGTGGTDGNIQLAPVMPIGGTHSWGMRAWIRTAAGIETELTSGVEAIVSRTTDGYGQQGAFWSPPDTAMTPTDSIVLRIYQGRNVGTPDTLVSEFSTAQLGATHLYSTLWQISYFTRRSSDLGAIQTRIIGHDDTVNAINWDATRIVSAGNDGKVISWNPTSFFMIDSENSHYNSPVLSFALDSISGDMYVGTQDCTVRKYPAAWNTYTPFSAHKPDVMIYVRNEREYYVDGPGGMELDVFSKIDEPIVYRWNQTFQAWDETNMTNIFGKAFYKGNLAIEWTEHGFLELALPKNFTAWPDQNEVYINSFICGDNTSRPQDTCPSDCNVPSEIGKWVDWTETEKVTLSAWGKLNTPEVTVNSTEIPSVSGTYHFGYHPSAALSNLYGSSIPMIVVESTTMGVWDRVYVDMNLDYVIDSQDSYVDKNNPVLELDIWNKSAPSSLPGLDTDGIPDVSGGLLYFIGNGITKLPYSDRMSELLLLSGEQRIPFDLDNPMPIPGNGDIVAFYGDMGFDVNRQTMDTHGTQMASAIAGEGLTIGDFGPIMGVSPNITFLPICNAQYGLDYALYFAVEGYDGIPNTGDEAQIVSVGQYFTGYNNGLDETTQLVDYLVETTDSNTVFISPAGNDGSGYGTVASPCGVNTLVVGFAEDNSFISNGGNVHHQGMVSELSSRGPTAAGLAKPDVIALGMGTVNLPLDFSGSIQTSVGGYEYTSWSSSDLASAVTTGVMALVFQAYKETYGLFPSTQDAMDIIRSSAKDLGYDALTQGAGFVDALAAVKLAKGETGLITSAQKTSFGNSFGENYDSFINVVSPGDSSSIPVTVENPTGDFQNTVYDFEYMNRIALEEYYQFVSTTYEADITDLIPPDAEIVKVTVQTNSSWWVPWVNGTGYDYESFISESGYYGLTLMDWVDSQPIGDPNYNVIDVSDDLNYLTSSKHELVNSLICTLSNPHGRTTGNLILQLAADSMNGVSNRMWKISIESFASTSMDWINSSKSSAGIGAGGSDSLNLIASVPANAEPGTYAGSFVTSSGSDTETYVDNIPYTPIPETEYLNTELYSTYWDDGVLGNYWDDYTSRYPGATNDLTVWDMPYELDPVNNADGFPLVDPVDAYSDARVASPPISIYGDWDFSTYAYFGDGSVADPWLIENLDIDGTMYSEPGIYIANTDDYFIIRNCAIHDAQGDNLGIYLSNVENGIIVNNDIYDNTGTGIEIAYSSNLMIDDNYIHNNQIYGITMDNSEYVYVYDNVITENTGPWTGMGIFMTYSSYCEIISNEIYNNDYALGSAGLGIESDCWYNVVAGNYFHDESWTGIETWDVYFTQIHNNTFEEVAESISLYGSTSPNTVVDNDFLNMGGAFAFDESPGVNNWDGNYWAEYSDVDIAPADGIWDNPYFIIDSDWSAPPGEYADNAARVNPIAAPVSYHTSRGIITIDGNTDFTVANGVIGGTGISSDPYIISGWGIDNTGEAYAISVQNTTAHFAIIDCMIYGTGTNGIFFYSAPNGCVRSNQIVSTEGITVQATSMFGISYNDIQVSGTGVNVIGSNNGIILNNHMVGGTNGIHLEMSMDCDIENNNVDASILTGLWLEDSTRIMVTGNTVSNSMDNGILLERASDCEISLNVFDSNDCGVYVTGTGNYFNELYQNNFLGNTIQAYDEFLGDVLADFELFDAEDVSVYDVISSTITVDGVPLIYGIDYTQNNDTGLITFTPVLSGWSGGTIVIISAVLAYEENLSQMTIKLPDTRLTDDAVIVSLSVAKRDGTVQVITDVDYNLYRKTGVMVLNSTLNIERGVTVYVTYNYYSQINIIPITLNVLTAELANFDFGNMDVNETESGVSIMPTWGVRSGRGSSLESGDRRYFYVNIPNQGMFGVSDLENIYLYSELIWDMYRSDLNVDIYGKGPASISPSLAPYSMTKLAGSEETYPGFLTNTGGPKEILIAPFNYEMLVICVSAKFFDGSGDSLTKFEGRGGWIRLSDNNPKAWTNDLVGQLNLSFQSSIDLQTGLFASVIGPAQSLQITEEIYQDDLSQYDLSTLEGWLTMNAMAGFSKVVNVENALSLDVHIMGHPECVDLDLAIFYDGKAGQPKDGIAQWQEMIDINDMEFDAYGDYYGTGPYCYCADSDANEAIKIFNPWDGDYIIKVVGYTVISQPGYFDLEVKTILAGIEGFELSSMEESTYPDQDGTVGDYLNNETVPGYETRNFAVSWNFPVETFDDTYGGIFVFGVPDMMQLITIGVDIVLDRDLPIIDSVYPGDGAELDFTEPEIGAYFSVDDEVEIDALSPILTIDGINVTSLSEIDVPLSEGIYGDGRWFGSANFIPITPMLNGQHTASLSVRDIAGNIAYEEWSFEIAYEPEIYHAPEIMTSVNSIIPINAIIESVFNIDSAQVHYMGVGEGTYSIVELLKIGTNSYYAQIPAQDTNGYLQYYLTVEDINANLVYSPPIGPDFAPYVVKVNDFDYPVISHDPALYYGDIDLEVSATISDNTQIFSAMLYYKTEMQGNYTGIPMNNIGGDEYVTAIDTSSLSPYNISYYIEASDGINEVTHPNNIDFPHEVQYISSTISGGDLSIAALEDIQTLNPLSAGDEWSWDVLSQIYGSTISLNPETEELMPYIAVGSANTSTSIDHSAGELSWDDCDIGNFGYTPRETWGWEDPSSDSGEAIIYYDFENVTWHDGHQMDVSDIMFSMHVAAQIPEWSSTMNCLKDNAGMVGTNFSETSFLHIYKVWESADGKQAALKFVLQESYPDFFRDTLSTFLLPEHIWAYTISGQNVDDAKIWCDPGYDIDSPDSWKVYLAQAYPNIAPIGSDVFKFEFWVPGMMSKVSTWRDHFFNENYKYTEYVLDSNGESLAVLPNIDSVTFKIYKTTDAAVQALESCDVDYISWSLPPTYVQELTNMPGIALQQTPQQGFIYMAYNMRRESFGYDEAKSFPYAIEDDIGKPFRKAVAHCINKQLIVSDLLLNMGIGGEGPVSSISSWFNETIPRYRFDPDEAKHILANAGYKVDMGGFYLSGQAAIDAAGAGNWWVNPDQSPIGSGPGGLIEILTPEANYDPIRAQAGLMIAQQLRDIGIYAQSIAMDYNSIIDSIDCRDFDMYILGWEIGSDPTDYLHAFFHSSGSQAGQNYPGYQNQTFDTIIDEARSTGDESIRKKDVEDAQAAIVYDLPYDVLYYRTNIEAYRSDRFTGWKIGSTGSIYNEYSLHNIRLITTDLPSPTPEKKESGGTMKVAIKTEPGIINPLVSPSNPTNVIDLVFDSLARIDPDTLELIPWIATDWQVSPDNLTVQVNLRNDVRWHDGQLLDAYDVKYTFDTYIIGYISSVTVIDSTTLEFNLAYPDSSFFTDVLLNKLVPQNYTTLDEGNGCGPFILSERIPGESLNITANPTYFAGRPNIDRISFQFYPYEIADWSSEYPYYSNFGVDPRYDGFYRAAHDLIQEKIDYIGWNLDTSNITQLIQVDGNMTNLLLSPNSNLMESSGLSQSHIGFNTASDHILNNTDIRKAIAYVVNKESLSLYDISGGTEISDSITSRYNIPYYNTSIQKYRSNIQTANEILDAAGYFDRNGDGWRDLATAPYDSFQIELLGPSMEDVTSYTMAINIMTWLHDIGLNTLLISNTSSANWQAVKDDDFDLYFETLYTEMDPIFLNNIVGTGSATNYANYENATMDALLDAMNVEMNQSERAKYAQDCFWSLNQELPYLPLLEIKSYNAYNNRFLGWESTLGGMSNFWSFINVYPTLDLASLDLPPANETIIPEHSNEYPAFGSVISDPTPTISVHVSDNSGVDESSIKLYVNGYSVKTIKTLISNNESVYYNVSYTHEAGFVDGQVITCRIVASDIYGNEMECTWQFTMDLIAPFVISSSPIDGSVDVWRNSTITVQFSEPMNQASVESAFSILPYISGNFTWEGNNMTYQPNKRLFANTLYSVAIGTNATDIAGNSISTTYSWAFTTVQSSILINHSSINESELGNEIVIYCTVEAFGGNLATNCTLYYIGAGNSTYIPVSMILVSGDAQYGNWSATIPAQYSAGTVQYYLIAWDDAGEYATSPETDAITNPYLIDIIETVSPEHHDEQPSDGSTVMTGVVTISVNITDLSAIDISTIQLIVNGFSVDYSHTPIPDGYCVSYIHEAGFSDGTVQCRIIAEDVWENSVDWSWSFTVETADIAPPQHSNECPPIDGQSLNLTPTISINITDPSGVNASTIKLYVNNFLILHQLTPIPGGYTVSYWHQSGFTENQTISCRIIAKDYSNNELNFTWTFRATEFAPPTFEIELTTGWNLVSFPLVQSDTSILTVLNSINGQWDIVRYYDATDPTDPWKRYATISPPTFNDLQNIDHTMGIWIHITENCTLQVSGEIPTYTNITLKEGWNLVGYSSLTERTISEALNGTEYDIVEGFNATDPEYLMALDDSYLMKPGEAYWVHVPAEIVWAIDW